MTLFDLLFGLESESGQIFSYGLLPIRTLIISQLRRKLKLVDKLLLISGTNIDCSFIAIVLFLNIIENYTDFTPTQSVSHGSHCGPFKKCHIFDIISIFLNCLKRMSGKSGSCLLRFAKIITAYHIVEDINLISLSEIQS